MVFTKVYSSIPGLIDVWGECLAGFQNSIEELDNSINYLRTNRDIAFRKQSNLLKKYSLENHLNSLNKVYAE